MKIIHTIPALLLTSTLFAVQAQADTLQTCLQTEKAEDGMASCVVMHAQRSARYIREFENALIPYLQGQERDQGRHGIVQDYRSNTASFTRSMVITCNKTSKPANVPGLDDKSPRLACQADAQYGRLEKLKTTYPTIKLTYQ